MTRSRKAVRLPAAILATVVTSTCECLNRVIPVAMFEIKEIPSTSISNWCASVTSGTVDMPTASAPSHRFHSKDEMVSLLRVKGRDHRNPGFEQGEHVIFVRYRDHLLMMSPDTTTQRKKR